MQGDGQFHHAQVGTQMAGIAREFVQDPAAEFAADLWQFLKAKFP
jgi:hypothetical protein